MAKVLQAHEGTKALGDIIAGWDCKDDPDKAAPLIFSNHIPPFCHGCV